MIKQKNRAVHSLITEEQTRRLELLIHLLSTSRQVLVVCGPEGIGKTTLLNALQEQKVESWCYCLVQGNADLSFEEIQGRIAEAIKQDKSDKQVQGMTGVFAQLESLHKEMVLMIDEAGQLMPGLINTIIDYAATKSYLRVILVFTHDDLYLKYKSDNAVEDCHFIEIPPLTERQCGEFLQHLAGQIKRQVPFDAFDDVIIESIYRETQGIPGRIIAKLPATVAPKQKENSPLILPGAVAGLVLIALGVQWYSTSEYNRPTPLESTETKQKDKSGQTSPVISEQFVKDVMRHLTESGKDNIASDKPGFGQAVLDQSLNNKQDSVESKQKLTESLVVDGQSDDRKMPNNTGLAVSKKPEIIARQEIEPVTEGQEQVADRQDNGEQWLRTLPGDNYTLQVMVLSKEQSVKNVIEKYPLLKDNLRYFKKVINGKEKFVLLYGSFASSTLAKQAKQSLPREFSNSFARKIGAFKN